MKNTQSLAKNTVFDYTLICTKSIATCTAALTECLHLIICKAHAICREARPHSFIIPIKLNLLLTGSSYLSEQWSTRVHLSGRGACKCPRNRIEMIT